MKKSLFIFGLVFLLSLEVSCSKDDSTETPILPQANTLIFKENQIVFNGLTIDDQASNNTSEYILTTESNLSMVFYCKYLNNTIQPNSAGLVTYATDAVNYFPVNNYSNLKVRGYVNYQNSQYFTDSGEIKIKRNEAGNQIIEFLNLKVRAGNDIQTLNGTINLPKS